MEGARAAPQRGAPNRKVAEKQAEYARLDPVEAIKRIEALEARMHQHARDLEFEQAAELRDEIEALRKVGFGFAAAGSS